jgi:hypothetical protein
LIVFLYRFCRQLLPALVTFGKLSQEHQISFRLVLPGPQTIATDKIAVKPRLARHWNYELPHITIQMPVYKEGLRGYAAHASEYGQQLTHCSVIVPTMISIMAAIEHYEQQGGTASVFVNDDGMQVIEPELAEARKEYYRENMIGFTARLPHMKNAPKKNSGSWLRKSKIANPEQEKVVSGPEILSPQALSNKTRFQRKGKFKKASNMNYGLDFSNRVENELYRLTKLFIAERKITDEDLAVEDDDTLYEQALDNMLAADEGRTCKEKQTFDFIAALKD